MRKINNIFTADVIFFFLNISKESLAFEFFLFYIYFVVCLCRNDTTACPVRAGAIRPDGHLQKTYLSQFVLLRCKIEKEENYEFEKQAGNY